MLKYYAENRYLTTDELLQNAKCIFDYLTKTTHWSANAVCGLLGNTFVESKHNPSAWENNKVGNLDRGYGIVQWTPASKYLDWAKSMGYAATDMEGQLLRLKYEMDNGFQYYKTDDYPLTFKQFIVSDKSPDYLAKAFIYNYERPGNPNVELRAQKAMEYYQLFVTDGEKEVNEPVPEEQNPSKYAGVNFLEEFQKENPWYTNPRPMNPAGIVLHSTGCNNPNLNRYVGSNNPLIGKNRYDNHWNHSTANKCAHMFGGKLVDKTPAIVQTLPFTQKCACVGKGPKGSYNNTHIQIEVCEDGLEDEKYYKDIFGMVETLFVALCKQFNIKVENIVGHYEAWAAGYGSNHGDPSVWMKKHGDSMDKFRARIAARLGNQTVPEEPVKEPEMLFEGKNVIVNTRLAEGLSLWDSPEKHESKIKAAKGAVLFVLDDPDTGWVYAKYNGKEGYVDKQYLVLAPNQEETKAKYVVVQTKYDAGLNLWDSPAKGKSNQKAPKGAILRILDDSDAKWSYAEYEGKKGYADKQYLVAYEPPEENDDGGEDNPEITTDGMTITIVCHKQADVDSIVEFVSNIDD
jgi:N-acetylmuramoyl-L-alanine amidase